MDSTPDKTLGCLDNADYTSQTCDSNKFLPNFRKNWLENMPGKKPKCGIVKPQESTVEKSKMLICKSAL